MKYYDKNGGVHDTLLQSYLEDSKIALKEKKEEITPQISNVNITLNNQQTIEIDHISHKIYLLDGRGDIVVEGDLDPRLLTEILDNLHIETGDPNLTESEFIDKVLDNHKVIEVLEGSDVSVTIDDKGTFSGFFNSVLNISSEVINSALLENTVIMKKGGNNIIKKLLTSAFRRKEKR